MQGRDGDIFPNIYARGTVMAMFLSPNNYHFVYSEHVLFHNNIHKNNNIFTFLYSLRPPFITYPWVGWCPSFLSSIQENEECGILMFTQWARVGPKCAKIQVSNMMMAWLLDPDMFSDPQMSIEVLLNIYDVIKILSSDWTADNSRFIASIAFLLVLNYTNRVYVLRL